ncbi:hypothetical protein HY439_00675 [Candidatus Microgenomates bacterium]|nr:hypothetical protein [Candidatus Microgenomates bacterium]
MTNEAQEFNGEIENKAKMLVTGVFGPEDVVVEMTHRRMPKNPELEKKIEEEWAPKAALGWFPGPCSRLEDFDLKDDKLILTVGDTDFREYTGSRDLATFRQYGFKCVSNPISASSVIVTCDGKIIIGQKISGDALGSIDAVGGYVHPEKDADSQGVVDIFKAARREIIEETPISEDEISQLLCLGVSYEYTGLCHPVVSFIAVTPLTSDEIKNRESEELRLIAVEPEKVPDSSDEHYVQDVLKKHYPHIEPDGRISIALARRWMSGKTQEKRIKRTIDQI